ncbi:MAG: glycoside hydrolase family 2 TIM barrel-domain containing protein, partial [Salegentibacter mishustinae]|nr:glycoside hydrolase family 2 TIM barrel-domain containing protein [Salegentibacter mishustinae]
MRSAYYFFILIFLWSFNLAAQRNIQTINSAWEFSSEKNKKTEIVNIPHTWNAEDTFRDGKEYFRGKGTYKKSLFVPQEWKQKKAFLKFEGSNQITTVFVNDKKIGEHRGGYTGFVFDISEALNYGEANQLRIVVDNAHNTDIPPLDADFNFYGGIYRDLQLILTNQIHFELENEATGNMLIKTPNVSAKSAKLSIETKIVNHSKASQNLQVSVDIFNPKKQKIETLTKKVQLSSAETKSVNFSKEITDPDLWSPDSPKLYEAVAKISEENSEEILDEIDSKFGLRWFEVSTEKGFVLNGKPIKLIGANRHQDFKGLGNALPISIHRSDYKTIKEMGSNVIRTAHYPQDPEVYKICDELGLL